MKTLLALLSLSLTLAGCSGDPPPTVGDAPIAKGIERKPMPQPPQGMAATSGLSARDVAKLRERR